MTYLIPIEQRYAMDIILLVEEREGLSKGAIIDAVSREYPRTVYARINHLVKIGVLRVVLYPDFPGIHLTRFGHELAEHIRAMNDIMKRLHDSLPEDDTEVDE